MTMTTTNPVNNKETDLDRAIIHKTVTTITYSYKQMLKHKVRELERK